MDEFKERKKILVKTFKALEEHNISMYYIIEEFQERYKEYNLRVHNLESLALQDNRVELVIKRDYDLAIDILTEHKVSNPHKYLN